jgi:GNAT superfamily N-acetyltransferase
VIEPEVIVRPAAHGDAAAIARLLAEGTRTPDAEDPSAPERYAEAMDRIRAAGGDVLVADYDGAVAGVCQVLLLQHLQHAGGKVGEVESVHVDDAHRRHGVGAALLSAAIEWAAASGCYRVQLTSHEDRGDAHRFYAAQGFVPSHVGFKLVLDDDVDEGARDPGGHDAVPDGASTRP